MPWTEACQRRPPGAVWPRVNRHRRRAGRRDLRGLGVASGAERAPGPGTDVSREVRCPVRAARRADPSHGTGCRGAPHPQSVKLPGSPHASPLAPCTACERGRPCPVSPPPPAEAPPAPPTPERVALVRSIPRALLPFGGSILTPRILETFCSFSWWLSGLALRFPVLHAAYPQGRRRLRREAGTGFCGRGCRLPRASRPEASMAPPEAPRGHLGVAGLGLAFLFPDGPSRCRTHRHV